MDSAITHFQKYVQKKTRNAIRLGPLTQRRLRRDHPPLCGPPTRWQQLQRTRPDDIQLLDGWLSAYLAALTRCAPTQCSRRKGGSGRPSRLAHPDASWQRSAPCHVGISSAERCTTYRRPP